MSLDRTISKVINYINGSKAFQHFLLIAITLYNFALMSNYVAWRDVARPLLYISDSKTMLDLFNIVRYDGTPMLYHFSLWLFSKIAPLTADVAIIYHLILHLIITVVIVYVIKIPNIYRLLLLLQIPQVIYVYYVRQYSMAVLFILLFAYFFIKHGRDNKWLYWSLFFLSQTTLHGCIVVFGFLFFLSLNRFLEEKKAFHKNYIIPFIGVVLFVVQLLPPADLIDGLKAWRPLLAVENLFFIKDFLSDVLLNDYAMGLGLILALYFTVKSCFSRNKNLAISSLVAIVVLLLGFYLIGCLKYSFNRHHWLLSYALISFLIILASPIKEKIEQVNWKHYSLVLLVFIGLNNCLTRVIKFQGLNSSGQVAAEYIDEEFPDSDLIAKVEFYIEPLILYSKTHNDYFSLPRQERVKYTVLNHETVDYTKYKDYIITLKYSDLLNDLKRTPVDILKRKPVLVLSAMKYINDIDSSLDGIIFNDEFKLQHLKNFEDARFENYRFYRVIPFEEI